MTMKLGSNKADCGIEISGSVSTQSRSVAGLRGPHDVIEKRCCIKRRTSGVAERLNGGNCQMQRVPLVSAFSSGSSGQ